MNNTDLFGEPVYHITNEYLYNLEEQLHQIQNDGRKYPEQAIRRLKQKIKMVKNTLKQK
jgi:hypothetical protein